ncbi:helix-turn-helix domain-containing protein [Virgibacillus sp. Bac332]|uniref:helix-turn-helix domain-containing protein n=1 Tax=Virgibacillus sp. Bac332 TaxID=2419842 RepID=UPI000EF53CB1|nr:helix-turn-helix transcriptional regulator [Virgibacillus sp. Bac332]
MITIAELRARNGKMSQKELAMEIGTSQTTVCAWEKDISVISSKHLKKVCLYFRVSADDLLGIESPGKKIS